MVCAARWAVTSGTAAIESVGALPGVCADEELAAVSRMSVNMTRDFLPLRVPESCGLVRSVILTKLLRILTGLTLPHLLSPLSLRRRRVFRSGRLARGGPRIERLLNRILDFGLAPQSDDLV